MSGHEPCQCAECLISISAGTPVVSMSRAEHDRKLVRELTLLGQDGTSTALSRPSDESFWHGQERCLGVPTDLTPPRDAGLINRLISERDRLLEKVEKLERKGGAIEIASRDKHTVSMTCDRCLSVLMLTSDQLISVRSMVVGLERTMAQSGWNLSQKSADDMGFGAICVGRHDRDLCPTCVYDAEVA